jgi:hypothetical protein
MCIRRLPLLRREEWLCEGRRVEVEEEKVNGEKYRRADAVKVMFTGYLQL